MYIIYKGKVSKFQDNMGESNAKIPKLWQTEPCLCFLELNIDLYTYSLN